MGVSNTWAADWHLQNNPSHIYFCDATTKWAPNSSDHIIFLMGRDDTYGQEGVGSQAYDMIHLSNTKLWYYNVPKWGDGNNGRYQYIAFRHATSAWTDWKSETVTHRATWENSKYSMTRNDNISDKTLYYEPQSSTANTNTNVTGYLPKYTATVDFKVSRDGGSSYDVTNKKFGTITLKGTYMNGDDATGQSSATITGENNYNYNDIPVTGEFTLTNTALTNDAYEFVGFGTGDTPTDKVNTKTWNITGNTIYYVFYKHKLYTVTYSKGTYGLGSNQTANKLHGETLALADKGAFTRTGYTQTAWNTNTDGKSGTSYALKANYTSNQAITLYPTWTANQSTIIWNANGGSVAPTSSTYTYDGEPVTLPTPTRTGYTFNGWFTASSGGSKISDVGNTNKPASNKTYYAQWTENTYTVNIVANPAEAAKTLTSGPKQVGINPVNIATTTNIGYQFVNWTATAGITIANANSASTTITATKAGTVTANFEEKFTTIYLEPTDYWNSDNPQYVAHVWIKNNISVNEDIIMEGVGEAPYKYYKAEVPYGYDGVVFFRKSTNDNTLWNKTNDLEIPTNDKVLYTITSAGKGQAESYNPAATGEWKEANLVYTITLGSSMFGPYGISYNGQSYFSKNDADVVISLPYGATINFIEGQPYSDIYTGGIMEQGKVRQINLTQPYTIERDIRFDANYVTKVPQVAYLGVPNNLTNDWDKNASYANFIWRHDSYDGIDMTGENDMATFEFEADGVKYYKFTIQPGCNKFIFQRKLPKPTLEESNGNIDQSRTLYYIYEVLTTDVNCYMLDGGLYGEKHTGYWCALPAREGDYRLLYVEQVVEKDANGYTIITRKKAHPSDVVKASEITQEGVIVSLHTYKDRTYEAKLDGGETYTSSNNPEIILQRYDGSKWVDEEWHMVYGPLETLPIMANLPGRKNASPSSDIDDLQYHDGIEIIKNDLMPNGDPHPDQGNGVWNFVIKQKEGGASGEATIDLEQTHRYTGTYYIRTNAAFGEWNSYKGSDNHMTRSDVSKRNSNYSHYYCKWIDQENTNVTYTIANDYGMAISDTLTADETDIWGTPDAQKIVTGEILPTNNEYEGANVRFSWNEKSNFLHRAYLAGSTNVANRFLVLKGKSDQLYNAEGQALTQGANGSDRWGLNANEEIFTDISNWVYYADVQMVPNADLKLTAKYIDKVQYFVGQESNWNNTILKSEEDCSDKYLIRLLYDFKTNELISAYVPGGQAGREIEAIETNLMLLRKENEPPRQLSFNANRMKDVGKQAYGVLELTKATLIDNPQSKNIYARSLYWISFPFDVRITDIFGFGEYGKHWIIQSYDGAKRAREGLWADSETNWVYHFDPNSLNAGTQDEGIMKKGVGYVVALNLKNIQAETPFVGRITTIALYFPSTTTITGHIVNENAVSISVPEHKCNINRPTPDGDRRIKDSHWNVIGVPSYINALGDFSGKINTIAEDVKFYYSWQGDHDKYEVVSGKSGVSFNSLNAYMVQFAGNLQWTNVLNESPAGMAAKRNSDNMQEHHLCLELQQNGNEQDRTFIQLQEDEVTTAFDFNYDLCKIKNGGANIYSLIATDRDPIEVAGNVLPVEEAIIPLGIKTDAAGEYTFAMPEGTDGIVVELIDYETNTRTNMLLDNYTVNLGKGTFDNRFALHVKPDKTTTSVDNLGNEETGDKVKKYLIDGILYMQKDGVLYDAQGRKL